MHCKLALKYKNPNDSKKADAHKWFFFMNSFVTKTEGLLNDEQIKRSLISGVAGEYWS